MLYTHICNLNFHNAKIPDVKMPRYNVFPGSYYIIPTRCRVGESDVRKYQMCNVGEMLRFSRITSPTKAIRATDGEEGVFVRMTNGRRLP